MSNGTNEEILTKMSQEVRDGINSFNYDFNDKCLDKDIFRAEVDNMLHKWNTNGITTASINKTEFPDDVILRIIESNMGCSVDSIDSFKSITSTWKETSPDRVGYVFEYTLLHKCEMVSFDIIIGERGSDQCE